MQFLLEGVVGGDRCMLFDEFAASALVLLLEGSLEIAELLVFCSKGISEHVHLALQLSYFLLIKLSKANHSIVNLLYFLIFCLDKLVKLSLFSLEELSPLLLLLRLSDQALRSELHLGT